MGFLDRAIKNGISKGISNAVGNAVKQAVEPKASSRSPAYRALLKANGFREAGQNPDKSHLYKKIDEKCYHVDTEHCFEGSMERPEIWFNIQEPSGGFDYVKPEPKKRFSFSNLFK